MSTANITLTHLHVSNCQQRASFSSLAFLPQLGFVGNGVINGTINSP